MRNSGWYHKLWRKKLDKYPLKHDAGTSWAEMRSLLDQHLPENETDLKKPAKFFGSTVISMLGFILPAAAMIGAITFVAVKHSFKNKTTGKTHYHIVHKKQTGDINNTDSAFNNNDSAANADKSLKTDSETMVATNGKAVSINILKNGNVFPGIIKAGLKADSSQASNHTSSYYKNNLAGNAGRSTPKVRTRNSGRPHQSKNNNEPLAIAIDKSKTQAAVTGNDNEEPAADNVVNHAGINKLNAESTAQSDKLTNGNTSKTNIKKISTATNAKAKTQKATEGESKYNYSLEVGANASTSGANTFFGIGGTYAINPKLLLNAGIRMDLMRPISGVITHTSYRNDTSFFNNTNSRKLNIVSIPVTLEYQISNTISVNAGPQISFSIKQSGLKNKLGTIANFRDTLEHTKSIDSALSINSINKINLGITGGVSIRVGQFYIDARLLQNVTPYKVTTGLGGYQNTYRSFQLGLRYKFRKKKS